MKIPATRWLGVSVCVVLALVLAPGARAATPQVQVAANAKLGKILVGSSGFTLYFLTPERAGKILCTGPCTTLWPPLLLPAGTAAPTAGAGVNGTLGVVTRDDGSRQVTYDGLPLYMFSHDLAPGDTNGQGFAHVWFAINAVSVPLAAIPMERVTIRITSTGGTVWGAVKLSYTSRGLRVQRTCAQSSCSFVIPHGAMVHLSQRATDAATWPFKQWQIQPMRTGSSGTIVTRPASSLRLTRGEVIAAVYVVSSGGGYGR